MNNIKQASPEGYWEVLKFRVLRVVNNFTEDFTEIDRKLLDGYSGEFIMGIRSTGTNLFLLDPKRYKDYTVSQMEKSIENHTIFMFEGMNIIFYHGKNDKVKKVKKQQAIKITTQYVQRMRLNRSACVA